MKALQKGKDQKYLLKVAPLKMIKCWKIIIPRLLSLRYQCKFEVFYETLALSLAFFLLC